MTAVTYGAMIRRSAVISALLVATTVAVANACGDSDEPDTADVCAEPVSAPTADVIECDAGYATLDCPDGRTIYANDSGSGIEGGEWQSEPTAATWSATDPRCGS